MFFYQNPLKWVKNLEISASSAFNPEQDGFGSNISAVSDLSTIVVTENTNNDVEPGALYVFAKQDGEYQLQQKLRASGMNVQETEFFGSNFGSNTRMISEDKNVIVAPGVDFFGRGAVAVFRSGSTGYAQEQTLIDEDGNPQGLAVFGYTIGLSEDGTRLIIGAAGNDDNGTDSGKVYIYKDVNGSFQKVQELAEEPAFGTPGSLFGRDGMYFRNAGSTLIVPFVGIHSGSVNFKGAVYVYESGSNGYELKDTLIDSDPNSTFFGYKSDCGTVTGKIVVQTDQHMKIFESGSNGYQEVQTITPPAGMGYVNPRFNADESKLYIIEQGTADGAGNDVHVFVSSSNGYQFVEEISLNGGGVEGYTGFVLSQAGDTMILGDYMDGTLATNAGAVFVYESGSNGWAQSQKILPTDDWDPSEDHFGVSCKISDDENLLFITQKNTFAVGTWPDLYSENTDSIGGSLYIFKKEGEGYRQIQRITDPAKPNVAYETFGNYFGVNGAGTRVCFGNSSRDFTPDANADYNGAIYVFDSGSNGFTLTQEIKREQSGAIDLFGWTVELSKTGQKLFSNYYGNDSVNFKGAVLVYQSGSNGFQEVQMLEANDPDGNPENDYFGDSSIVISDDENVLLVGAYGDEEGANSGAGAVYVFVSGSSGYQQTQKLELTDPVGNWSYFGFANGVALSDDNSEIAIGVHNENYGNNRIGRVMVYESGSNGYQLSQNIEAPSESVNSRQFGWSVDISGSYLVVGATLDPRSAEDTAFRNRGAAYVYEKVNGTYELKHRIVQEDDRNTQGYFTQERGSFGHFVKLLSNNELLISSPHDDLNGTDSGVVYKYKLTRDY